MQLPNLAGYDYIHISMLPINFDSLSLLDNSSAEGKQNRFLSRLPCILNDKSSCPPISDLVNAGTRRKNKNLIKFEAKLILNIIGNFCFFPTNLK